MSIFTLLKKFKIYILISVIVGLSAFLRFYNLNNIYVFNFDEEYQATYAWTQVLDPHPIWIGVSASFLEFYLGPYFTYFSAFLLWLSSGDPMITAYFAAFLGVITTTVIFFVGWKIFNLTTGAVASLLYATLPLFVFYDQKYWNTMFSNLITVLLLLTIVLIKKNAWFWILYAALFGVVLETHLIPAPLFLIGLFFFLKDKYFKNLKLFLSCVLVFLFFYWPLIVFDLNHDFSNLTAFARIKSSFSQSKIAFDPETKFKSLFDSLGRFWYLRAGNPNADEINFSCNPLTIKSEFKNMDLHSSRTDAPSLLSILTLFLLIYFFWVSKSSKNKEYKLLALFLLVALLSFVIYPGASSEYYTLSIMVLFIFVPGILISGLKKRQQLFSLILIFIISFLGINTVLRTSDEFSLGPKRQLISKVMSVVGDSFAIEGRGICHNYEGWRYLFKVYGRTPAQSYTDSSLGWLYPSEISKIKVEYTVILSEDRIPLNEDLSTLQSFKAGGYRVYIRKEE